MVVVDDQLLLALLSGTAPRVLVDELTTGQVFTTGSWYYRLGRAVASGSDSGALSGRFSVLPESSRRSVRQALDDLPAQFGLLSLRTLVPVMQVIRVSRPLNFLNAEGIAAAVLLDARIAVSTESALLSLACRELHIGFDLMDV